MSTHRAGQRVRLGKGSALQWDMKAANIRHVVRTIVQLLLALVYVLVLTVGYTHHQSPAAVVNYWATELGVRAGPMDSSTAYEFEATYGPAHLPTRWPACATIEYQTNLAYAPPNASTILQRALRVIHGITGFNFVDIGLTTKTNFMRYDLSGAVATVILAWVNSNLMLGQTNVNGVTRPIVNPAGTDYTSAVVLFDTDINSSFESDHDFATTLVLHEEAHVVGLGDVNNPTQVMYTFLSPGAGLTAYARGDLAGLRNLSTPGCA
jgi:hypothetical protein